MAARTHPFQSAVPVCIALLVLLLALGCQSEQDRYDEHLRRAYAALSRGGAEETAVIELLNALQIKPDSEEVNFLLGQARQTQGLMRDALFFYEEAHYLDPESTRTAVALALTLRLSDVRRANELVGAALERDPENARVYSALAELALEREDPQGALSAAKRSVELNPRLSFGYLTVGRAHMAEIRMARLLEERPAQASFAGAEAAFKRYTELLNPREQWNGLIEQARVLATWPGHSEAAQAKFLEAMAAADENAHKAGAIRVASHLLEFARVRRNDELRADALERLLELEPEHLPYWDELAQLRELSGGDGGETLVQLIEEQPHNAEAHLRYAGYLQATQGSAAAIDHLLENSENDALRPTLLGALVELYGATGQRTTRDDTLSLLEDEYPFHPMTLLTRANLAFRQGRVEVAAQDLRHLVERRVGANAEALLGYAEFALGNYQASLDAISRAISMNQRFESELLELRAKAAYGSGDCAVGGPAMLQLKREKRLEDPQKVWLAHCLYTSGNKPQGRKLLRTLLSTPAPPVEAVLEFAEREMDRAGQRAFARDKLEDALQRHPRNTALHLQLAEARRRDGLTREGIEGVNTALRLGGNRAKLVLARARLHADAGDAESAQRDARRALDLNPNLPGALKIYVSALALLERYDEAIDAFTQGQGAPSDANRMAILGRLYLKAGRREEGRDALLSAYLMGCRVPDVLHELTLMLVNDDENLPGALQMARQAAEQTNYSADSLYMLGYVHLHFGQADTALGYFDRALEQSSSPDSTQTEEAIASFHFRKGLALQALGRPAEASTAFKRAHALDPSLPLSPPPTPTAQSQRNSNAASADPS